MQMFKGLKSGSERVDRSGDELELYWDRGSEFDKCRNAQQRFIQNPDSERPRFTYAMYAVHASRWMCALKKAASKVHSVQLTSLACAVSRRGLWIEWLRLRSWRASLGSDRYGRWVTRRVAIVTIAIVWLLAALISFLPISLGLHRPDEEALATQKPPRYPTCALVLTPTYAVVSSCISFYLPCIVMISIYCRLYCYAQKHVKSIRAVTRTVQMPDNRTKSVRTRVHTHVHSSPYHVSDHKAAVTVGVIMGVFLLCWVPFFCVNIVAAFCKTCIPAPYITVPQTHKSRLEARERPATPFRASPGLLMPCSFLLEGAVDAAWDHRHALKATVSECLKRLKARPTIGYGTVDRSEQEMASPGFA
ncbi:Dopamine receptor 1 [Eumeta japonica]|uniref:Dopamine receptor 1 n=1 Tax=Eumeta variegata TaxID=151549 RepID=A0A4C1ZX30_EUMVA|nr:Dopamine receptor 1 [Eumeta japonica]